ncbi:SRPBCC family protein [Nocardioides sp. GXQ0305]|uniref:SRPBCC family protein n=1 Tax=Nocardioides sp. GXQ0305 TaxID=3423912 RepID=UPI003D7E053A
MATFSGRRHDVAEVPHPVEAVWELLVDPDQIARMTPLVHSIEVDEQERWVWHLHKVPLLGRGVDLTMTQEMDFTPTSRIDFRHPPLGPRSRAGAEGHYLLAPVHGATRLEIDLTVRVQLPVPGVTRAAVQPAIHGVLVQMGHRFATNLLAELRRRG